eukprot:TRINITY_DN12471_c0_g1_i1.p1 TRINITY_DN12471_c0_g1~~TRINITY_DN12471_c0_g1_i1.p1  ORF type:complete len:564 (-),score=128.60 TRINITY_DN12471_c0_g1_i1:210-1817(-)
MCIRDSSHTFQNAPLSLEDLLKQLKLIFTSSFPQDPQLSFTDDEGERFVIASQHDYETVINDDVSGQRAVRKLSLISHGEEKDLEDLSFGEEEEDFEVVENDSDLNTRKVKTLNVTGTTTSTNDSKKVNKQVASPISAGPQNTRLMSSSFSQSPLFEAAVQAAIERMLPQLSDRLYGMQKTCQQDKKKAIQASVVHEGVSCKQCGMSPIMGIRYKCSVREDYDLCEDCEEYLPATYAFLKIRHPAHAPHQSSVNSTGNTGQKNRRKSSMKKEPVVYVKKPVEAPKDFVIAPEPALHGKFGRLMNSFPKSLTTATKHSLRTYEIKNTGNKKWPEGVIVTLLGKREEDHEHEIEVGALWPGEIACVTLPYDPEGVSGKFSTHWTLGHRDKKGHLNTFGDVFEVDYEIEDQIELSQISKITSTILNLFGGRADEIRKWVQSKVHHYLTENELLSSYADYIEGALFEANSHQASNQRHEPIIDTSNQCSRTFFWNCVNLLSFGMFHPATVQLLWCLVSLSCWRPSQREGTHIRVCIVIV